MDRLQHDGLETCYCQLLAVETAKAQLEELGVESSEDLWDLDKEDVVDLAKFLKKVTGKKLLRILGLDKVTRP